VEPILKLILEQILEQILKQILNNHNIANTNILTIQKIYLNSELSPTELYLFDISTVMLSSLRSNIHLDNLLLTTEYTVLVNRNEFFSTINDVPKEINITNWVVQVGGTILLTIFPTKFYIANSQMDFYATFEGIILFSLWPARGIAEDIYIHVDNVSLYFSQDGLEGIVRKSGFAMVGYGHNIVKNSNLAGSVYTVDDPGMCVYDDPPTFNHILENLHFAIGEFDTSTEEEVVTSLYSALSADVIYNLTISNVTFENLSSGPGNLELFSVTTRSVNHYVYIQDVTFNNVYAVLPLMLHYGAGIFSIKNIILQDCIQDNNPLIWVEEASELIMDNISFNNSTVISDFTGELVDILRFHSFIF
jgi:hypothetical protein